jgi:hypothetical protein
MKSASQLTDQAQVPNPFKATWFGSPSNARVRIIELPVGGMVKLGSHSAPRPVAVASIWLSGNERVKVFDKDIFRNAPPGRMSIENLIIFGGPVLVAWTLAVLILSLWQSWPTLRHVARRPGFIACVMVVVALVDRGTYFAIRVTTEGGPINDRISLHLANSLLTLPEFVGLLISGAWLALVLSGKWSRRPTGVDRVGCLLGLCWLAIFLANEVYFVVLLPLML